jgi:hypothetical protein
VSTTDTHTHTKRSTRAHANKKNASQSQLHKPMMVWIHISYTRYFVLELFFAYGKPCGD